jgi:radical SAM protein with 4Fe4S-binding SPASM domain
MNYPKIAINSYVTKKEPFSVVHFITNRCNARCKHCFIDFDNPETFKRELKLEEIQKLTKTFGKSLFNINITGGEPFLRQDIFEIAKAYYDNTNIESIFITTNGMYTEWTKNFLDKFIQAGIEKKIIFSFSIDNFRAEHDKNRKVEGLFDNVLKTYRLVQSYQKPNIMGNVAITVTHHNYDKVIELYHYLKTEEGITAITATAMREEGVVKSIEPEMKKNIFNAYMELTKLIHKDIASGEMEGYKRGLQGTIMNSKNIIVNKIFEKIYLNPQYVSHCPAGALFGVIGANGEVYPCEILDKPLGNLREYDLNFLKLWNNQATTNVKKFIKDTKCNCSYECAWSINIISNKKYIPQLIKHSIKQKLNQSK